MSRTPDLEVGTDEPTALDTAEMRSYAEDIDRVSSRLREGGALGVVLVDASALEAIEQPFVPEGLVK